MRKTLNYKLIGALTSKPYSFKSRSWELKYLESIDLHDSLGSNIKINYRGSTILRILPNINENINEEWITDKIRFSYDSLYRWRFNIPLIKDSTNLNYKEISWNQIFVIINNLIKKKKIKFFEGHLGDYTDLTSALLFKQLLNTMGPSTLITSNQKNFVANDFIYSQTINYKELSKNISNKIFIFIGSNVRLENPILNLKFRKLSKQNNILLGYIGGSYNTTCYMYHLGNNINIMTNLLEGKHWFSLIFSKFISRNFLFTKQFQNTISFILGNNLLSRIDSLALIKSINILANQFKFSINIVYPTMGLLTGEIIHFNQYYNNKNYNTLYYLLGTEIFNYKKISNNLIIFQGHHNDISRDIFDIILPSVTFLESNDLYINCLNILQETKGINIPLKEIKKNQEILFLLAKYTFQKKLQSLLSLPKQLKNMLGKKTINNLNLYNNFYVNLNYLPSKFYNTNLKNVIVNYYLSNSMARASKNMINCSKHNFINNYIYLWK